MYLISIEGMYLSRQTNQSEVSLNMKEPDVPNEQGGFNKGAEWFYTVYTHVYASGSDSTPSFILAHWNIDILLQKQAKWRTIMHTTVIQLV